MKSTLLMRVLYLSIFLTYAANAQTTSDSLIQLLPTLELSKQKVDVINQIAHLYVSNNTNTSRYYAERANNLALSIAYTTGQARATTIKAGSFWYEGNYTLALEYYHEAARLYLNADEMVGYSETLNNIGEVFKALKEYGQAQKYYDQALAIRLENNLMNKTSLVYYNIGELQLFQGKLAEAQESFLKSLLLSEENEEASYMAYANYGLGNVYMEKDDFVTSHIYFFKAADIWKEKNNKRGTTLVLQKLAALYYKQGELEAAKKMVNNSIEVAKQFGALNQVSTSYVLLSTIDSAQGNYLDAFSHFKQSTAIKDSIFSEQKSNQIIKMQSFFEKEIKNKENLILQNEKQLQQNQIEKQTLFITVLVIAVLIFSILIYYMAKQNAERKKTYELLKQRKNKIDSQHREILYKTEELNSLNEHLNSLNLELESKVLKRTLQLETQNQQLSDYAFINAHKLRAPVASILGLIDLLEKEPINGDVRDYIQMLGKCGTELDLVIRNIKLRLQEEGILEEHKKSE